MVLNFILLMELGNSDHSFHTIFIVLFSFTRILLIIELFDTFLVPVFIFCDPVSNFKLLLIFLDRLNHLSRCSFFPLILRQIPQNDIFFPIIDLFCFAVQYIEQIEAIVDVLLSQWTFVCFERDLQCNGVISLFQDAYQLSFLVRFQTKSVNIDLEYVLKDGVKIILHRIKV